MSNLDIVAVKRNITMLLKKEGIPQKKLADAIGMTQPNMSKALNENDKRFFSVEQIYRIAQFFNASIDSILGYSASGTVSTPDKAIAEFIIKLLEEDKVELTKIHTKEERVDIQYYDNGYPDDRSDWFDASYTAIYFPNYSESHRRTIEYSADRKHEVNNTWNEDLNSFIEDFPEILKLYKNQKISKEAYVGVVDSFLEKLEEISF